MNANLLSMYMKTSVYCEDHTKNFNKLCVNNVELLVIKHPVDVVDTA